VLDLLNSIFAWITNLVPRLVVIRTTHAAVAFVRGKHLVYLGPGLHVYWPLWTELHLYPTCLQTVNLTEQTLVTDDGKTVAVNGVVCYEIHDLMQLLSKVWDPERAIADVCLAGVKRVVCQRRLDELLDDHTRIDGMLTRKLRSHLEKYGITVVQATLSDIAPCRVFKFWGLLRG